MTNTERLKSAEKHANTYLYNQYKHIPYAKRQCLASLALEWEFVKPLQDQNVLLNGHLTLATLIIIDILLLAGAKVTVTTTPDLVVHTGPLQALAKAGIKYFPSQDLPENYKKRYFDIVFDCGAGLLADIEPKIGMIELTKTDPSLYQDICFPVESVDDSNLKSIETYAGTGEGLVRALKKYYSEHLDYEISVFEKSLRSEKFNLEELKIDIESLKKENKLRLVNMEVDGGIFDMELSTDFKHDKINGHALRQQKIEEEIRDVSKKIEVLKRVIRKKNDDLYNIEKTLFVNNKYIIFGYGKVGCGIVNAFLSAGVKADRIVIIDIQSEACKRAEFDGHIALQLGNKKFTEQIKKHLQNAFCVITATGKAHCISENFELADFSRPELLINMGTPDEWGPKFKNQVLNNKKPFNFILDYPTDVAYLDPIFKALLVAGANLKSHTHQAGLYPLSDKIDRKIVSQWKLFYPELATHIQFWRLQKTKNDEFSGKFFHSKRPSDSPTDSLILTDSSDEQLLDCETSMTSSSSLDSMSPVSSPVGSPRKDGLTRSLSCSDLKDTKRIR